MIVTIKQVSTPPAELKDFLVKYPYLPYHYIPGNTQEQRADYFISLLEGKKIYLAYADDQIIAVAGYQRCGWDEELFGFNFARLKPVAVFSDNYEVGRGAMRAIGESVIQHAKSENVKFIDAKCEAADVQQLHGMEDCGFRVVNSEGTYVLLSSKGAFYLSEATRLTEEKDLPELCEIARKTFVENRFMYDPRFDREKAGEFYVKWLKSAFENKDDNRILISHIGKNEIPTGFSTGHVCADANEFFTKKVGSLDLTGVNPRMVARRVGTALVSGVVDFVSQRTDFVETVISVQNSPSARGVMVMRFRIKTVRFDMHCWL